MFDTREIYFVCDGWWSFMLWSELNFMNLDCCILIFFFWSRTVICDGCFWLERQFFSLSRSPIESYYWYSTVNKADLKAWHLLSVSKNKTERLRWKKYVMSSLLYTLKVSFPDHQLLCWSKRALKKEKATSWQKVRLSQSFKIPMTTSVACW